MMMRAGQALLLPASPWFIWATLFGGLFVNMVVQIGLMGRAAWVPDVLAITLAFWIIHQPRRVGVGIAFLFGLLTDVHHGSLLGQHALAYAVLGYLSVLIHRRLLWFDLPRQALHVLPLFVITHLLQWMARGLAGSGWAGWSALAAPALETLLWPLATVLLLAPQRRAHDRDDNRPI